MANRNYPPAECEQCRVPFTPTGPGQIYCPEHRKGSWERNNPEKAREASRKNTRRYRHLREHGDADVYDRLVAVLGETCGVCGAEPDTPYGLAVDHDHESGAVRGLLCPAHNTGLGYFGDDPVHLRAAGDYLEADRSSLAVLLAAVEVEPPPKFPNRSVSGWSRRHERCRECGTTEKKHYAKGFCVDCYGPYIRALRAERGYVRTDRPRRTDEEKRRARSEAARRVQASRTDEEKAALSAKLSEARIGRRKAYRVDGSWFWAKPGEFVECGCGTALADEGVPHSCTTT